MRLDELKNRKKVEPVISKQVSGQQEYFEQGSEPVAEIVETNKHTVEPSGIDTNSEKAVLNGQDFSVKAFGEGLPTIGSGGIDTTSTKEKVGGVGIISDNTSTNLPSTEKGKVVSEDEVKEETKMLFGKLHKKGSDGKFHIVK